ncbi:hypothetical protein BKA62DRAFT_663677 [Auriculariales sp. MPI-PUGE-AT-0066]|nr:hypothetical protein BKA62DRAFT_663677 [Auriculariales sp. MPI-PUGE-AT-0066]
MGACLSRRTRNHDAQVQEDIPIVVIADRSQPQAIDGQQGQIHTHIDGGRDGPRCFKSIGSNFAQCRYTPDDIGRTEPEVIVVDQPGSHEEHLIPTYMVLAGHIDLGILTNLYLEPNMTHGLSALVLAIPVNSNDKNALRRISEAVELCTALRYIELLEAVSPILTMMSRAMRTVKILVIKGSRPKLSDGHLHNLFPNLTSLIQGNHVPHPYLPCRPASTLITARVTSDTADFAQALVRNNHLATLDICLRPVVKTDARADLERDEKRLLQVLKPARAHLQHLRINFSSAIISNRTQIAELAGWMSYCTNVRMLTLRGGTRNWMPDPIRALSGIVETWDLQHGSRLRELLVECDVSHCRQWVGIINKELALARMWDTTVTQNLGRPAGCLRSLRILRLLINMQAGSIHLEESYLCFMIHDVLRYQCRRRRIRLVIQFVHSA